jgi:hypothetical protein
MHKITRPKEISQIAVVTASKQNINGDNLNNIRSETNRDFENKKRDYMKHKIHDLAMNSKNKNIRDLY